MSEAPPPDNDILSAGSLLRQARERQGVRLEEAAGVTRISKGYLKALEEDCYDRLPNEAYARGFLRVYARFLGIPEDEIIGAALMGDSEQAQAEDDVNGRRESDTAVGSGRFARRRILLALPLSLLAAALMIVILLPRKRDAVQPDIKLIPRAAETAKIASPVPAQPLEAMEPPAAVESAKTDAVPFEAPASPAKGIVLRVKALENASLDITIDSITSQHYDLEAGDIIEWKGEKRFTLDLQNAGGVEAELNGSTLAPFGDKGASAHVVLNARADMGDSAP